MHTRTHANTHTHLPQNVIVRLRLPHPLSRDSQVQEMFLAPSADKQTRNYDTVLKAPSVPITIRHWD